MSFQSKQASASEPMEPDPPVLVSAHRKLLTEILDSLMQGTQFLALTGAPGVGKTTMAAAIYEELNKRSVLVGRIDDRSGTGIHLRTIMSQFLGKPEAEIDADDVEQLFHAMTGHGSSRERLTLIVDDAERLLPDALAYLRLLASVALECMPQIVFIGSPSLLEIADQLTEPGFRELTTARFVLEPRNSAQTSGAAEHLISSPSDTLRPGLASEATIADSRKRAIGVEATARQLESGTASPVADQLGPRLELGIKATTRSVPAHDVPALLPELIIQRPNRSFARIAIAAAAVVGTIGVAAYWLAPFGVDRSSPARRAAAWHQDIAQANPPASPGAEIQVRLPFSASALQAQSDAPNFDSTSEFPVVTFVPMSGNPSALATPQIRPRARMTPARAGPVPPRELPGDHVSPTTSGTWLFPPNANGGG